VEDKIRSCSQEMCRCRFGGVEVRGFVKEVALGAKAAGLSLKELAFRGYKCCRKQC
jgi:hypothetical protein